MEISIITKSIKVLDDLAFNIGRDFVYEEKYGISKPILEVMRTYSKNKEYSYKEVEELLLVLSSNPDNYTERTFRYYYQTNITPKPIKPARNRSYFNSLHIISYLFVEEFKEFYELEEISEMIDNLEIVSRELDPLKIYDYYQYLTSSRTYYIEFAEMLGSKLGMDTSKSYEESEVIPEGWKLSKSEYNRIRLALATFRMERKSDLKRYSELVKDLPEDKYIKEAFNNFLITMELILSAKKKLAILNKIKK